MKYLDSVRRAGRSLKNAKARTILTAMAIGVSRQMAEYQVKEIEKALDK